MRFSELKESMLNGLTVMSLKQFVKAEDEDLSLEDDEDLLGESRLFEKDGEFGLGSKYRNASHKEMQDYLDRTVFKRKNKLDKFKMPYIHPSNIKKNADGSIPIIDENGDKYDLEVLKKAITKRPKEILSQNAKMKHSNGTADVYYNMGMAALVGLAVDESTGNFVIVNTCVGAGSCKLICFAMHGSYIMFPGVSLRQSQVLNFLLNDPEGFKNQLIKEIQKAYDKWHKYSDEEFTKGSVAVGIRVHDSADFISPEYMELMWDVARTFPQINFYAYTKVASVANDKNKPDNFIINFSAGALSNQSNLVNIKTTKHSHIVPKDLFYDLIARNGKTLIKTKEGAQQFKSQDAWEEFKERLSEKYDIEPDTILSYEEFMKKKFDNDLGDECYYNVVICPGEGDVSAVTPQVLGTYLLQH